MSEFQCLIAYEAITLIGPETVTLGAGQVKSRLLSKGLLCMPHMSCNKSSLGKTDEKDHLDNHLSDMQDGWLIWGSLISCMIC